MKLVSLIGESLRPLVMLPMSDEACVRAAEIYRRLRKQGIPMRKTNDCLIAAVVLDHDCRLLHHDRDFAPIEKHFPLQVIAA